MDVSCMTAVFLLMLSVVITTVNTQNSTTGGPCTKLGSKCSVAADCCSNCCISGVCGAKSSCPGGEDPCSVHHHQNNVTRKQICTIGKVVRNVANEMEGILGGLTGIAESFGGIVSAATRVLLDPLNLVEGVKGIVKSVEELVKSLRNIGTSLEGVVPALEGALVMVEQLIA